MSDKKSSSYVMNCLPGRWTHTAQQKIRETCVQMELSGSVKETKNVEIKADEGLMTCRKTRERFLQSEVCDADNLGIFAKQLAVQNAEGCQRLFCPIDGSSLKISDSTGHKGLGPVGTKASGAKGYIVQNSYLVDQDGIPCGILYQKYFTRPADICESQIWAETLERTIRILSEERLAELALIIMDRGYDSPEILDWLRTKSVKIMIRATQNRKVCSPETESAKVARETSKPALDYLSEFPQMATMEVSVPVVLKDKDTPAGTSNVSTTERRTCLLGLKSAPIKIFLRPKRYRDLPKSAGIDEAKRERLSPATVVLAEEINPPDEFAPVRWMLWLNYEVNSPEELQGVINDYRMRWRIEEFHKIWKSSGTNVEKTQARSAEMIERLARIAAVVASNIARMQRFLEANPDTPATTCFTKKEVESFKSVDVYYYKGRLAKKHDPHSLAFVMALFAKVGGYENGSKTKVGAKMLTRGYQQVMNVIAGMRIRDAILAKMRQTNA